MKSTIIWPDTAVLERNTLEEFLKSLIEERNWVITNVVPIKWHKTNAAYVVAEAIIFVEK